MAEAKVTILAGTLAVHSCGGSRGADDASSFPVPWFVGAGTLGDRMPRSKDDPQQRPPARAFN